MAGGWASSIRKGRGMPHLVPAVRRGRRFEEKGRVFMEFKIKHLRTTGAQFKQKLRYVFVQFRPEVLPRAHVIRVIFIQI